MDIWDRDYETARPCDIDLSDVNQMTTLLWYACKYDSSKPITWIKKQFNTALANDESHSNIQSIRLINGIFKLCGFDEDDREYERLTKVRLVYTSIADMKRLYW